MASFPSPRNSTHRTRFGPAQWLIAAFAVLVHGLLLTLPAKKPAGAPVHPMLELEFHRDGSRTALTEPARALPSEVNQFEPAGPRPEPAMETESSSGNAFKPLRRDPVPVQRPRITAATLLEHARQMGIPARADPDAQLGKAGDRHADGWKFDPILPVGQTLFGDSFLPAENEIMDQWQDPDGTRHVVMRTPSGQTLCGRLDSWDPLNPLVEPVAMYRPCAGGGRRHR